MRGFGEAVRVCGGTLAPSCCVGRLERVLRDGAVVASASGGIKDNLH